MKAEIKGPREQCSNLLRTGDIFRRLPSFFDA
jgi:hypothetical protein